MRVKRFPVMVALSLSVVPLLVGCQKAPAPGSTAQSIAPAPPPPPETSQGKLVRAEFAPKTKMRVTYLTTSGLKSEVREEEAGKGNVYVVLYFENKPASAKKASDVVALKSGSDGRFEAQGDSDERELWLTDSAGKKYGEPSGYWENKESGRISFEVPQGLTGLVFHDGKAAQFPIKPVAVAVPPQPAAAPAKK
jgi:hypothetical protein